MPTRTSSTSLRSRFTMADIKRRNAAAGWFFFSRATTKFFGPEKFSGPYEGPGGVFFVKTGARTGVKVCQFDPRTGEVDHVEWDAGSTEKGREIAKSRARGTPRKNPAVACSPNKKRDRYRAAKVMHKGEWVQNGGCWDAKGVPSYVGKGETGKRRVIAKKAVRQKASRTPSRVKGVRARKRS